MNDLQHLHFEVGPALEAAGGTLDKFDYNRLRQLGVTLRNIPDTREDGDWDIPPATLQGWIKSYGATVETIQIAEKSGLLSVIKSKSQEIKELLSPEMIPLLDTYIIPKERIEDMIVHAKKYNKFDHYDFDAFPRNAVSGEDIARVVIVTLDTSVRWDERPKVDKSVGFKRLQIGALIGKAAAGGALAVARLIFRSGRLLVFQSCQLSLGMFRLLFASLALHIQALLQHATQLRKSPQ